MVRLMLVVTLGALLPFAEAVALVVSDPTSYTYYVEQIKKMSDQLKSAQDTVKNTADILNTANDMKKQLVGTYNRAVGAIDEIKKLKQQAEVMGSAMGKVATWGGDSAGGFVDAQKVLDENFVDLRDDTSNRYRDSEKRYQAQQTALKNAIVHSDHLLQKMPERFKAIEDLAGQIDGTLNVKDATDLSNRILVEILKSLAELLALTSHMAEAQSLVNYSGVNDATLQQRKVVLEDAAKQLPKLDVFSTYLKGRGVSNPRTMKLDDWLSVAGAK